MVQFCRDLDLVEHPDRWQRASFQRLGDDASPKMFLATAGERSKRIHLGTGVISLPYHHSFQHCTARGAARPAGR